MFFFFLSWVLTLSMQYDKYICHGHFCSATSWGIYMPYSDSWKTGGKLKICVSVSKKNFTEKHIQEKWINFIVIMLNYSSKVDYNWLRYGTTLSRVLGTVWLLLTIITVIMIFFSNFFWIRDNTTFLWLYFLFCKQIFRWKMTNLNAIK